MVILEVGEDNNNLWLNNTEVLYNTILDNPHQNISEKKPIINHSVLNRH